MEITQAVIDEWKLIFAEYRLLLHPNKKGVEEVVGYLKQRYRLHEDPSEEAKQVVVNNIVMNEAFSAKVPHGKELIPVVLKVLREENGNQLYEKQEEMFENCPIIIGMEFETGCIFVEGSSALADEITAFQGLDQDDLENYYLVANYIRCLKKRGLLETVVQQA
ncbi:hypothetical protein [Anoxynatronum sibiricum]|uniref:Uncharacterized protein n=1 Tax=Anoxynatronum sibiricum TaxID=210623 RepID=A0ABU9VWS7_9CLOT